MAITSTTSTVPQIDWDYEAMKGRVALPLRPNTLAYRLLEIIKDFDEEDLCDDRISSLVALIMVQVEREDAEISQQIFAAQQSALYESVRYGIGRSDYTNTIGMNVNHNNELTDSAKSTYEIFKDLFSAKNPLGGSGS